MTSAQKIRVAIIFCPQADDKNQSDGSPSGAVRLASRLAGDTGFEPVLPEPESGVLPLD